MGRFVFAPNTKTELEKDNYFKNFANLRSWVVVDFEEQGEMLVAIIQSGQSY